MNNINSLVSVVVPVFNAETYIAATLSSALNQTHQNLEVLVVDDCSTDNTLDIVNKIAMVDDRVTVINLKNNKGAPAGPRNIGINRSSGDWIALLDADDIWHPRKLEIQLSLLKKTGAYFCSSASFNFVKDRDIEFDQDLKWNYGKVTFIKQLINSRIPTSSVVVLTSIMKKTPFNESMDYKAREDLDCFLRVHEEIPFSIKSKMPLMAYRVVKGQISGNKLTMIKRHLHVLKNYRTLDGKRLGYLAYICTVSHFALAVIPRLILKIQ